MNEKQNKYKQKAVDSLLNFETVKYYGAEQEEVNQYNDSIKLYQVWINSLFDLGVMNTMIKSKKS